MDRQAVIDRVRKYRALAENNNSDNEASEALKRAKKLMKDHQIAEHEVVGTTPDDVGEWEVPGYFNDGSRLSLLTCACQVYGCKAIRVMEVVEDKASHTMVDVWYGKIIGRRQDADIVLYVFAYYEQAMNEVVKSSGYHLSDEKREESCRRGIVYGIHRRITTEQTKRKEVPLPATTKVVSRTEQKPEAVTNRFLDNKYAQRSRSTAGQTEATDRTSFYEGYEAARSIRLIDQDSAAVAALAAKAEGEKKGEEQSCQG